MATPILEDLRRAFPNSKITAMCQAHLAPLLHYDSVLSELFCFSRPKQLFRRMNHRNIVEKLKKGKYDLGLLLTNSFSSAWQFWQGNVKNRIGFRGNRRNIFLNQSLPFPKERNSQHLVKTYKALLSPLGIAESETAPRLIVREEECQAAWRFLHRFGVGPSQKLIGIHPGAAYGGAKCWFPDRFRLIAEKCIERDPSYTVLFFGDLSQKNLIGTICKKLPSRVVNLVGKTSIRELMALIKICLVFLTNDSGPMHIASSLKVPLIALFGSTDPRLTGPYLQSGQIIRKKVFCSPCFKRECPIDFRCMKDIEVDEVFERLCTSLEQEVIGV